MIRIRTDGERGLGEEGEEEGEEVPGFGGQSVVGRRMPTSNLFALVSSEDGRVCV